MKRGGDEMGIEGSRKRTRVGDEMRLAGVDPASGWVVSSSTSATLSTSQSLLSWNSAMYGSVNGFSRYQQNNQQVEVKGRGTDPAAKQSAISLKVTYAYDETIRVKAAAHTWPSNWNPSIDDKSKAFWSGKGLPAFYVKKTVGVADYIIGNEPCIEAHNSVTNLDSQQKYGFIGFTQNASKLHGDGGQTGMGDPGGTVDTFGLTTTINTGTEPIRAGDKIVCIWEAYSVERDGKRVSKWVVKGLSDEMLLPQLLPIRTRNISTTLAMLMMEANDYFESMWTDPVAFASNFDARSRAYVDKLTNQWSKIQPFYWHTVFHVYSFLFDRLLIWAMYEMVANTSASVSITQMLNRVYEQAAGALKKYYSLQLRQGGQYNKETEARLPIPMRHNFAGAVDLKFDVGTTKRFVDLEGGWRNANQMQGFLKGALHRSRADAEELITNQFAGEAVTDAPAGGDFDILIRATG